MKKHSTNILAVSAGLALSHSLPAAVYFTDDFETGETVGNAPADSSWVPVQGGIIVRDSTTVAPFGAGNQYLMTVSFDISWDSVNTDSYMRWTLRGDNATNGLRPLHRIDVGGGVNDIGVVASGAAGAQINEDTAYRFDIVFNFNAAATGAYNGANTVAANSMDLWIDGVLIIDDEAFDRENNEVNTEIADFGFWAQKGTDPNLGNFYFDDYQIDDSAVVTFNPVPVDRPLEFTDIEVDPEAAEVCLTWASNEAAIYSIERTEDLNGPWLEIEDDITGTAGTSTWPDTTVLELGKQRCFYRVRLVSEP